MDRPNVDGSSASDLRPPVPTFGEFVERSLELLERRGRVSHTALRLEFSLDDATFAALREELVDVLHAADDDGRILSARNGHAPAADAASPASAPAADRPRISVLLCDLDETPQLLALEAETHAVITARLHAICIEVAARLRGHVQPWVSDGVAIFFGHPRAHDDDALHAVRCGWEILRTLAAAREAIEREYGLRVGARLGIATGFAGDGADAANAFGDTPRIAGRVQQRGAPDRVSVDEPTRAQAHEHFAFDRLDNDLFAVSAPLHAGTAARHAPVAVVGRTGERALLQALAERAVGGTRSAVLIRGEAGVGKTRLLEALGASAQDDLGMVLLHCSCSPYHRGSALHPLLAGLHRLWQLDRAEASARLAARTRGLAGGERAIALLAGMLDVALPDGVAPAPAMSPRRRRRETLAVLAAAIASEAGRGPLLLVVEDLHWADPTTIELLATLLEGPRELALMLALTARSEFVPPASALLQRVELRRLDLAESHRLVGLVATEGTLPDGLAPELALRSGGSPLLAEELTRTALATQDAGATGTATLYGCLMARLDRDCTARSVARLAATVGREFDVTLLEAVGVVERSALDWGLERLVQEDVIVPTAPGSFAFRHTLLQDAARSSLGQEALRDHNLRIAHTLLESFPHVVAAEPERVARHFEYAGELPASVRHWQQAGLQALRRHALREATGHFERGLELTARTPDGDERRAVELSLRVLAGLSIASRLDWGAPAAVAHYARAEQLQSAIAGSAQTFRALLDLTRYRVVSGRVQEAVTLARELVKVAEDQRDEALVLEAECEAGSALVQVGRHREALRHLARAIEIYGPSDHHDHARRFGRNPAAIALVNRGIALACRDDRAGARDAIAQAAELLRAQRHPYSQAWVQCAAATAALICGERAIVLRESAVAIKLATEEGFDDWLAYGSVLHGWARVRCGEHAEGLEECRGGVAAWTAGGAVAGRPILHGLLGETLGRAGEPELGVLAVDEALRWASGGERWCEPELHRIRAELLFASGDRIAAERSARSAVALSRRACARGWERRALATLGRVGNGSAVA